MTLSLKTEWMNMPDDCFEPLTFGELMVGQKFISLPCPGDNSGHGGLKMAHYLFVKTQQNVAKIKGSFHVRGRAVDISHNTSSDFPNSMLVVLVE